jgi:hypothetical protein
MRFSLTKKLYADKEERKRKNQGQAELCLVNLFAINVKHDSKAIAFIDKLEINGNNNRL